MPQVPATVLPPWATVAIQLIISVCTLLATLGLPLIAWYLKNRLDKQDQVLATTAENVDGKLTKLIEQTDRAAFAEGKAEGKTEARQRSTDPEQSI